MDVFGTPPSSPNRDSWTEKIKNDLQVSIYNQNTRSPGGPKHIVMCRVEPQLRELKPEHYAAAEFSFGLFDRSPLDAPQTRADRCRISMAGAVLEAMGMTNDGSWEELCHMVVPDAKEMQDRYNELERDPLSLKDVRSVLTLDAVFLASYLGSKYNKDLFATIFPRFQFAIDPMTRAEKIHPLLVDLFKVENQIPLSLIRTVLRIMLKTAAVGKYSVNVDWLADETFRRICEGAIDTFCSQLPGYDEDADYSETVDYRECDNFLDCMYKGMFYSIRIPKRRKNGTSSVRVRQRYLETKHRTESQNGYSSVLARQRNLEAKYRMQSQYSPYSVTNQDCKVDIQHLTARENGDFSVPVRQRNLEPKYWMESQYSPSSVTNQDCNLDVQHLTARENGDSSVPVRQRNLEPRYWMESQYGPSSVTHQDCKVDIQHLTARENGGSYVTRQDGKLEGQPWMRSERGTTAESNGWPEQGRKAVIQPSVTEFRKPPGIRGREVDGLEMEIISSFKIAPSVRSQASKQDCRPLKPSENGTATSQDTKLEHQPMKRSEDGTAKSQDRRLGRKPQKKPECDPTPQKSKRGKEAVILPSVTELRKAGIAFKGRKGYSFHDIELEKGLLTATLHLPTLTMNDDTEIIWRNLVAYEHARGNENPEFIQFLDFMDRLIDSQDDVKYLRSKKHPVILDNLLGTNKAVAKLFNNTVLQNSYYEATEKWKLLHRDVFDFYNQPGRRLYLEFRKTYFGKPWMAISVVGAAILLALTFLQTYYAVLSYYKQY